MKNELIMDSFAILLDSFECDRICPYCIAKNDQKFNFESLEDYDNLEKIFKDFTKENIHFKMAVIFGNGEPTLYPYETLERLLNLIIKYKHLFDRIDYYTSGLVFHEKDKFELYNNSINMGLETTFVICIVSFNQDLDQKILKHKKLYFNDNFKKAHNIKLSICMNEFLNLKTLRKDLIDFATKYPNVKTYYFKRLRPGENCNTSQYKWVKKYGFDKEKNESLRSEITKIFKEEPILKDKTLKYLNPEEGRRHLVFARGNLCDFHENIMEVKEIRNKVLKEEYGLYE